MTDTHNLALVLDTLQAVAEDVLDTVAEARAALEPQEVQQTDDQVTYRQFYTVERGQKCQK